MWYTSHNCFESIFSFHSGLHRWPYRTLQSFTKTMMAKNGSVITDAMRRQLNQQVIDLLVDRRFRASLANSLDAAASQDKLGYMAPLPPAAAAASLVYPPPMAAPVGYLPHRPPPQPQYMGASGAATLPPPPSTVLGPYMHNGSGSNAGAVYAYHRCDSIPLPAAAARLRLRSSGGAPGAPVYALPYPVPAPRGGGGVQEAPVAAAAGPYGPCMCPRSHRYSLL